MRRTWYNKKGFWKKKIPYSFFLFIMLIFLLVLLLFHTISGEEVIKNIVVFGDSYSDTGNKQRLTNGPLWNEHLAVGWDASLYNFAFSGAVCDNGMYATDTFIPSIIDQVEMYYKQNMSLNPEETVVIFWVGVNDIYKIFKEHDTIQSEQASKVVECISTNIVSKKKTKSIHAVYLFTL